MLKKILSNFFIIIGILCIAVSAVMFFQNMRIEDNAKTTTENAIAEIEKVMEQQPTEKKVLFDENVYVAILEIPVLGLKLPVQDTCTDSGLLSSPCIYKTQPLSIAAHNYKSHFGYLYSLKLGDTASITDISNITQEYEVVSVSTIHQTNVEKLEDENYDLTLFTCNYSNESERILVRLNKI